MLIGISGKMGVGKTTMAKVFAEEAGFNHVSFGNSVKAEINDILVANAIAFDARGLYGTQAEKQELLWLYREQLPPEFNCKGFRYFCQINDNDNVAITYRALMQWYGAFRRQQNPDYWIQRLINTTNLSENVVVDDVRYLNEAVMLLCLGATLIRVNWDKPTKSQHISETQLDNFPSFKVTISKPKDCALENYLFTCKELLTGGLYEPRGNLKVITREPA